MTILGRNTPSGFGDIRSIGERGVSKVTLDTPGRLDELYAYLQNQQSTFPVRVILYDDDGSNGEPGSLLAQTSTLNIPNSGFTTRGGPVTLPINLAAGNYWIGIHSGGNSIVIDNDGSATPRRVVDGALGDNFSDGTATTWGASRNTTDTGSYQAWGIVGTAVNPSGVATSIKFGTGLDVTDQGGGVIKVDAVSGSSVETKVDAKGDLLVASADNTLARLPIGANDQVLAADSTQATGVKWATPASGGGGTGYVRAVKTHTTGSLAANASETSLLTVFPGWRAFKFSTSRPARVRVYSTAAYRTADASRPIGTPPTGDNGLLLEMVTSPSLLSYVLSPAVDFASDAAGSSDFYVAVTNLDTAAGTVVTTYNYVRTE